MDRHERRARRRAASGLEVLGGRGLAHQDRVSLDREGAAPFGHGQHLDQVGIEVELLADLAQACRKPEEELLAAILEAECRVEARVEELPITDRAN